MTPATDLDAGSVLALSFPIFFISLSFSKHRTLSYSILGFLLSLYPTHLFSVFSDYSSVDSCVPPLSYRASGITLDQCRHQVSSLRSMWCYVARILAKSTGNISLLGASVSNIRDLNFSSEMCGRSTRSFQSFGKGAPDGARTGPAPSGSAGARCVMNGRPRARPWDSAVVHRCLGRPAGRPRHLCTTAE